MTEVIAISKDTMGEMQGSWKPGDRAEAAGAPSPVLSSPGCAFYLLDPLYKGNYQVSEGPKALYLMP